MEPHLLRHLPGPHRMADEEYARRVNLERIPEELKHLLDVECEAEKALARSDDEPAALDPEGGRAAGAAGVEEHVLAAAGAVVEKEHREGTGGVGRRAEPHRHLTAAGGEREP